MTMEQNNNVNEADRLVVHDNLLLALTSWTPTTTHEFLVLMPWLKCLLYNCERCVLLMAYHLVEQRHSFTNASYKSSNTLNLELPLHQRHLFPLYHYQWPIFHIWKSAFIALILTIGRMRESILPITTCIWRIVPSCLPQRFSAS